MSFASIAYSPVDAVTIYTYHFYGPVILSTGGYDYVEDTNILCTFLWSNATTYSFILNSTNHLETVHCYNTPGTSMSWNYSTALNLTSTIQFQQEETTETFRLFIADTEQANSQYTFQVTDFSGMQNAFLKLEAFTAGSTFTLEQFSLSNVGTPKFNLQTYQTYTLTFDCDKGTYSKEFTAGNTYSETLIVLASNFPESTTEDATATASRLNATTISLSYDDPEELTTQLDIQISHMYGSTEVIDYSTTQYATNTYSLEATVGNETDYFVSIQASRSGAITEWKFSLPVQTLTNPFDGVFDFLGTWPPGVDPTQLVATVIIMFCLGLGSFRSAGVSCILAVIVAGFFIAINWFTMSIPMFALAFVFGIMVVLAEGKETVRDV
jgi:hypothetical protein